MNKELLAIFILSVIVFVLIIYTVVIGRRFKKADQKFRLMCKGNNLASLETTILNRFKEIDSIESNFQELKAKLDNIEKLVNRSYQKTSIKRYDAYEELGGQLSFVICMLDNKDDGFLLNMVCGRDGSYSYVKEVVGGDSLVKLNEEEEEVLIRTTEKE